MRLTKVLVILGIVLGSGYFLVTRFLLPTQETWVHGTWWYADSAGKVIEGPDKDGMLFHPNGTVDLIHGSRAAYLHCVYTAVVTGEINMKCKVRGQNREMIFVIGPDKKSLASVEDYDGGAYIKE